MASFLSLPAELRYMIYEYLLIAHRYLYIDPRWKDCNVSKFNAAPIPLLLTNKIISREARNVLYSRNCFDFARPGLACKFLDEIGHETASYIRSIVIFLGYFFHENLVDDSIRMSEKMGSDCTGLKTVLLNGIHGKKIDAKRYSTLNASLRAIPSVQTIIAVFVKGEENLRKELESLGWKVKFLINPEPFSLDWLRV